MWIIAHYLPVSFFSLKPAVATSSGGKTLLVPTPYALKMAFIKAHFVWPASCRMITLCLSSCQRY
jgi:hypothetical protein